MIHSIVNSGTRWYHFFGRSLVKSGTVSDVTVSMVACGVSRVELDKCLNSMEENIDDLGLFNTNNDFSISKNRFEFVV